MRPFSDRFRDSLRTAHLVATLCELYFPGQAEPVTVPIEAGQVTIDRSAKVRRSGSVQIPWSLQAGADLGLDLRTLPLGGYARLYRGLHYPGRTQELILLGHMRVESVTWRTTDQVASLELADRMAQVRDEPFLAPYAPTQLTPVTRDGTLADDSAIVTGLAQTSDLVQGMSVSGLGVVPGTKIASIDSGSQVTLTRPVNLYAVKDAIMRHDSFVFDVESTADLTVGMTLGGSWYAGEQLTAILSSTRCQSTRWIPGDDNWAASVSFTLPATQSLTFAGTVMIADVAIDVVHAVYGDTIGYTKLVDPAIALGDVFYSGSRADAVSALAFAASAEAYFDAFGDFVFGPPPDPAADPVWRIDAGEHGVLIGADESLNRTGVFNGVLVQGQDSATDQPIVGLVVDNDPASPTYWGGPFGRVARVEQSNAVQTVPQALDAAQALLGKRLGLTRSLTITAAPNPALEAGDTVEVVFPDGRDELHVIDAVKLDLGAQAAQALVLQAHDTPGSARWSPLPTQDRFRFYAGRQAWREANTARLVTA